MNNKYNVVLLFGPPGSGKGTWGKILGMMPGFFHVATGDMFRMLNVESKLGLRVMEIVRKGELVPDDITFNMWQEHVKNAVFVGSFRPQKDVLVLDGLPRTTRQAEMLQSVAAVRAILKLDCEDHEILIERLHRRAVLEGRGDDANEAIIRHRFEIYNRQIQQTLAFYPRDMMAYIDVTIPPVRILAAIGNVLSKSLTSTS